ncbi:MAG: shikimate kinase [Cytophagales bacterium]|nr:shikimate kinase [Cytophagales bacterium]
MKIFLVGLLGSGKSTLGKQLARHLKYNYIDTDLVIAQNEGKTVDEIFSTAGESHFRTLEANLIKQLVTNDDIVVSTGGGLPCFHDNMAVMNAAGITIFIDTALDTIVDRLYNQPNKEQRPMLKGLNKTEINTLINTLHKQRLTFYKEAKFTISGKNVELKHLIPIFDNLD